MSTKTSLKSTGRPEALEGWTDEELLLEYRKKKRRDCFETLMSRYEREVYSFLRRYIGSVALAEEAYQGTFLMVHLKCSQFDASRRVRPWLYAIATNQAIDVQRRNRRHKMASLDAPGQTTPGRWEPGSWAEKMTDPLPNPLDEAASEEYRVWVRQAIHSLSDSLRQVVELVYFQGLRYRETADALDIPVGTVKSRMHAAVTRLHELWRESFGETTPE